MGDSTPKPAYDALRPLHRRVNIDIFYFPRHAADKPLDSMSPYLGFRFFFSARPICVTIIAGHPQLAVIDYQYANCAGLGCQKTLLLHHTQGIKWRQYGVVSADPAQRCYYYTINTTVGLCLPKSLGEHQNTRRRDMVTIDNASRGQPREGRCPPPKNGHVWVTMQTVRENTDR